ncbi:hypothetical protein Zmor_022711 [Zophobas morio]|uniref:Enkurin domain-containing protein n=1 Tax=Zophobas morio TaxID=2755281 RepID=A0AA38HWL6_9CUCU|nr:hypothetical protein Zmor_022711 [Zophobas morio]
MNTTTLRGIFPEAKRAHARNFVRENIRQLKEMQGYMNDSKVSSKSQIIKPDKFKHVAPRVYSYMNTTRRKTSKDLIGKKAVSYNQIKGLKSPLLKAKLGSRIKNMSKAVQTERPEDLPKLYETGTLKYPSPGIMPQSKPPTQRTRDHGDVLAKSMHKLELEEKHNYVRENIKNVKGNKTKFEAPQPRVPAAGQPKGVVPKNTKDQKEGKDELSKPVDFEVDIVSGLVLLPDEERKEYLRVARENYAALIKELNTMPMSNDTLKKRKRKMEIEDELRRLEEVIKIFQKPKVFVKADA